MCEIGLGIDGFSQWYNLYLVKSAVTIYKSETILDAVDKFGHSRIRIDKGVENVNIAQFMLEKRGIDRRSVLTGSSVHNQCIERL